MRQFWFDLLTSIAKYLGIVVGGTAAFMLVTPLIGYVPYSDRPGPGWHGGFLQISWQEFVGYLGFLGEWLIFLVAPYALAVAIISFSLVRASERFGTPLAAVRVVGAVVTAALTFLMLAASGWYISLGLAAGLCGTALAAYVGAFQLPRTRSVPVAA
jgi:hypothetical protein